MGGWIFPIPEGVLVLDIVILENRGGLWWDLDLRLLGFGLGILKFGDSWFWDCCRALICISVLVLSSWFWRGFDCRPCYLVFAEEGWGREQGFVLWFGCRSCGLLARVGKERCLTRWIPGFCLGWRWFLAPLVLGWIEGGVGLPAVALLRFSLQCLFAHRGWISRINDVSSSSFLATGV